MINNVFPGQISPSLMFVTAHWAYLGPIFNCSASVHLHFALESSSVFTYLFMAHGCAIPSIMFYQHMCILFMKLSEFLNYLSRLHFHLTNESPHCCLLSISVHQYWIISKLLYDIWIDFQVAGDFGAMLSDDETQCVEKATVIFFRKM